MGLTVPMLLESSVVVSALLTWTGGLSAWELRLEEAAVLTAKVGCTGAWLLEGAALRLTAGAGSASSSMLFESSLVVSELLAWTGGLSAEERRLEEAAVLTAKVGCTGAWLLVAAALGLAAGAGPPFSS
jgi:hypothetical protein